MTVVNGYEQSDAEKKLNILNLPSLADEAKKIIPTGGYGYIVGVLKMSGPWPKIQRRLITLRLFLRHCPTLILQICPPTSWALISRRQL